MVLTWTVSQNCIDLKIRLGNYFIPFHKHIEYTKLFELSFQQEKNEI